MRFLTDVRELNKHLKREPYPLPKINNMIQTLEYFTYATTLDLSVGYYHLLLDDETSKLCSMHLPFENMNTNNYLKVLCLLLTVSNAKYHIYSMI